MTWNMISFPVLQNQNMLSKNFRKKRGTLGKKRAILFLILSTQILEKNTQIWFQAGKLLHNFPESCCTILVCTSFLMKLIFIILGAVSKLSTSGQCDFWWKWQTKRSKGSNHSIMHIYSLIKKHGWKRKSILLMLNFSCADASQACSESWSCTKESSKEKGKSSYSCIALILL